LRGGGGSWNCGDISASLKYAELPKYSAANFGGEGAKTKSKAFNNLKKAPLKIVGLKGRN